MALSRYLSSISIGRKLVIGFSLLIVLAALVGVVGIIQLNNFSQRTFIVVQADAMSNALTSARIHEKNFMLRGDEEELARATQSSDAASAIAKDLHNHLQVASDLALLSTVEDGASQYNALLQSLADSRHARNEVVEQLEQDASLTVSRLNTEAQLYMAARAIRNMRNHERSFLIQNDRAAIAEFKQEGEQAIDSIEASFAHDVAKEEVITLFNAYMSTFDAAVSRAAELAALEERLVQTARQIVEAAETLQGIQLDNMERDHRNAMVMIGVAIAIALLAGVLLAWSLARTILMPLREAVNVATNVASGDLRDDVHSERGDELGRLLNALGSMVTNLRSLVKDINNGSEDMATSTGELSEITARTSQDMSQQRDQTDQVATAMNEMVATVNDVAKSAEEAFSAAAEASETTTQGEAVVGETLSYVSELNGLVENVMQQLHDLQADTQNIGSVLDVIKSVAEQTNLLALNAAIEAARAGEQGRGFAVVADEVRSLAQRTQTSASEIETLITNLVSSAERSVTAMESGNQLAGKTLDSARTTGETIQQIAQAVDSIRQFNSQIATAAEQQSSVAEEINLNVTHIRDISDQSAVSADQVAGASNELARLGDTLKTQVSRFSV
ncbi:methyl-accepting chemotaxis protein [Marinobacter sp. X15-166B]|uniref:methyl-accepting chemotaxis protein n=1 Tax=Marinobacter sp. X15-166B TaxID=1897620 RepID=UPI00085C645F|nr:methyl-accepting chemotaxis protein [Marinobacter sp. X15-166B]OEY68076.1 chemotaxis protein [Marinobacter sp. X15-166B]